MHRISDYIAGIGSGVAITALWGLGHLLVALGRTFGL